MFSLLIISIAQSTGTTYTKLWRKVRIFNIVEQYSLSPFKFKQKGVGQYESSSDTVYYLSTMGTDKRLSLIKIKASDGDLVGSRIVGSETCSVVYSMASYSSDVSNNR